MKTEVLLHSKKLLDTRLKFGSMSSLLKVARGCIRDEEVEFENVDDIITMKDLRDAVLKRIGLMIVERNPRIDHREIDEIVRYAEEEFGFDVVALDLGEGDYSSGLELSVNVERKDSDFIYSLFNQGHIYEQLKSMDDNPQVKSAYLFVNKSWDDIKNDMLIRNIPESVLITYVVELCLMGYPPVFISDRHDMMLTINKLFEKYYEEPDRIKVVDKAIGVKLKTFDTIELPGVKKVMAQRLFEQFGNVKNIASASEMDLIKIKGIGKKMAHDIFEMFNKNIKAKQSGDDHELE
jgi:ERCC4-type nuclease